MSDEVLRAAERVWEQDQSPEAERALSIQRARAGLCSQVERVLWLPTYGPVGRAVGAMEELLGAEMPATRVVETWPAHRPGRHPAHCSACSAYVRRVANLSWRRSWRQRARAVVDVILAAMPADASIKEKRKALREERWIESHATGVKAWREASADALGLPSKRNGTRPVPVETPLFGGVKACT